MKNLDIDIVLSIILSWSEPQAIPSWVADLQGFPDHLNYNFLDPSWSWTITTLQNNVYVLDFEKIIAGLGYLPLYLSKEYQKLLDDEADEKTADYVIQYSLFGEIKYEYQPSSTTSLQ